jgi:transcriptional regulator with XRE-family HTH domain
MQQLPRLTFARLGVGSGDGRPSRAIARELDGGEDYAVISRSGSVMKTKGRKRGQRLAPVGQPNPVDVHVGQRLRMRRTLLGMSQTQIGEAVGLTFQQVQKYERGTNRVSASRLFDFSRVLNVSISYFFDEMEGSVAEAGRKHAMGVAEKNPEPYERDPMAKRETIEFVRAYLKISSPKVRKRLFEMTKAFAAAGPTRVAGNRA